MKKETLLSLLMTAPVAFPALADVNLQGLTLPGEDGANWKSEASSFIDGYKADGAGMYCPVGIKSISRVLTLPQGKYKISLAGNNNAKLEITGATAELNSKKEVVGFEIKSGSAVNVTVKITPKDAKKDYSFTALNLILSFNWDINATKPVNDAFAKIADIIPLQTPYRGVKNETATAKALDNEKKTLDKVLAKITSAKAEVNDEQSLPVYINHSLWANPNTLVDSIQKFVPQVADFNKRMEAENKRFVLNTDNAKQKAEYLNTQKDLVSKVNALKTKVDKIVKDKAPADKYQTITEEGYQATVNKLVADLPGIKTMIESTYAASKLDSEIDGSAINEALGNIEDTYYEISGSLDGASADLLAYNTFKANNQFIALDKAYQEASIALSQDPKAKKDYPSNAFAEKAVALNLIIDNAYKAAADYVNVTTNEDGTKTAVLKRIAGASGADGKAALAEQAIQEAIDAINAEVDNAESTWKTFVKGQNDAMAVAYQAIADAKKAQSDAIKGLNVPAQFEQEMNGFSQAVATAIQNMKNEIDAHYGVDLEASSYTEAQNGVAKAQQALDGFVTKATEISKLMTSYETLKTEVKKADTPDGFLQGLYATDYADIDKAIAALKTVDDSKGVAAIKTKIENLQKVSADLVGAFKNANVNSDYTSLTSYIASDKILVEGAEAARTEINNRIKSEKIAEKVAEVNKAIKEITDAHTSDGVMDTYRAIVKLNEKSAPIREAIEAIRAAFTKDGSQKNLKVVEDEITILQTKLNAALIVDKDSNNKETQESKDKKAGQKLIDTLNGKVANLKTAINNGDGSDEAKYNGYDKTIKDTYIAKDLKAIKDKLKKIIDNYDAKVALDKATQNLETRINALEALNNEISKAGAQVHYNNLINNAKTGYKKTLADLKKKIQDAYEKGAGSTSNAAAKKSAYLKEVNDFLTGTVEPMFTNIPANEAAHEVQLTKSQNVRKTIEDVQDKLAHTANGGVGFNPFESDLKKFSDTLVKYDSDVTAQYEKGNSDAFAGEINPKLDQLKAEVQALLEGFADSYTKAVIEQNKKLLDELGWTDVKKKLDKTYTGSIETFINYSYKISNVKYKEFVDGTVFPGDATFPANTTPGFSNIEVLFGYQPEIGKLQERVDKIVADANSTANNHNPVLLTSDDLADVIADGNKLDSDMDKVGKKATAEANYFAEEYWTLNYEAKKDIVADKEQTLSDGGVRNWSIMVPDPKDKNKTIEKKILTNLTDALAADKTALQEIDKKANGVNDKGDILPTRKEHLGADMNSIADEFDKIKELTPEQEQEIASGMWADAYSKTTAELNKVSAAIDALEFVTDADKKQPKKDFNAAVAEINKTNGNTVKVTEGLLGNKLTKAMADLKTQYEAALKQYTDLKAKNDNNKENQNLFNGFTADIKALNADFKALCDFAGTLAASNDVLRSIRNEIETLEAKVNDNKADYSSEKDNIKNGISKLKNITIPDGYSTVADAELTAINLKLADVQSAWAEVSGLESTTLDLAALRTQIENLQKKISTGEGNDVLIKKIAAAKALPKTADRVAAIKALSGDMLSIEQELSELEVTLKSSWDKNPLPDVIKKLTDRYLELDKAISSLGEYDEAVQAEYQESFDAYKSRLDAIKGAWEAAGDNVLMQQGNFIDGMDKLSGEVDNSLVEVKAMQQKIDDNNEAYTTLKADYDKVVATLEAVKAQLEADDVFFPLPGEEDENGVAKPNADKAGYLQTVAAAEKRLAETSKKLEADYAEGNMKLTDGADSSALKGWADTTDDKGTIIKNIAAIVNDLYNDALLKAEENTKNVVKSALEATIDNLNTATILPEVRKQLLEKYDQVAKTATDFFEDPSADKGNLSGEKRQALAKKNIAAAHAILASAAEIDATGNENTFKPGDLNRDGDTDIIDVQQLISLVGEGTEYAALVEAGEAVKAAAADMNGDSRFTASDIAKVLNVLYDEPIAVTLERYATSRSVSDGLNLVTVSYVGEEAGLRRFAINVQNSIAMVVGQLDIKLPEGMTLVEVKTAERASGHDAALFHHSSSDKRVVLYNMDNAEITGMNGAVLYVDVIGNGNIDVENVIFADTAARDHIFNKPEGTSGIEDTMIDNSGSTVERIYNVAGQALRKIQRGAVNIIRKSDGSVSKEYRK